jgi:transcriptional regulator with XRE-family HTH domain
MAEPRSDLARTPAERFGRRVAAKRAERGWSMRDLCTRAGLAPAPSAIKRLEDTGGVSLNTAARVARALGISLDGLLDPCGQCGDKPPAGFTCQACGAEDEVPQS